LIAEPTLEHYIYYLRRVEGDDSQAIQARRAAFEEELSGLLAHLARLSDQPIPPWEWPQESQDRHISQRVVGIDWLDNPATGRSCFVEVRTYWDVYWLQVGYCQEGQTGPEIFASLRDEAWQPSITHHLLGSSVYLCGIGADEPGVDGLAHQTVAAYTGNMPGTMVSTHLRAAHPAPWSPRLYGSVEQPYVTALLYPPECELEVGRDVLNDVALRLELYKHKADRQLAWCRENYSILSEQEQSLRDLLEEANQASPVNLELLRQLVRLYRVFNDNAGMLADRQTTIRFSLENLDSVLDELQMEGQDRFLAGIRDRLRRRERQLEADLTYAEQLRKRADAAVNAIRADLGLNWLVNLQAEPSRAALIERAGWPGTPPPAESDRDTFTPDQKPPQPATYPQVNAPPHIFLTTEEKVLLQHVYRGFDRVLVEKEFGGGYGGARVLLTKPITTDDLPVARRVTKLGPAAELCRERDNYEQCVEDFLPFSAARLETERYYERNDQAGLSYIFVGGGALGQAMDLEEYYRQAASSGDVEPIVQTLGDLLDRELGDRWYENTTPLHRFFAAEYSRHMVEHLRLRLRPASSDGMWLEGQSPAPVSDYRQIDDEMIPAACDGIRPGTLLTTLGLVVRHIKRRVVKLEDPGGQGVVVRVELGPASDVGQGFKAGDHVTVRGEVVYNRRSRMEHIIRSALPNLLPGVDSEFIKLPCEVRKHPNWTYPNPLMVYPRVLSRLLEARQSYVHGDLHLRNVLVDGFGKGWLIDFAKVEKRHNLFDFIKLETYVRLMELTHDKRAFSLCDYARFEEALNDATLGKSATPPNDPHLLFAYKVILAIRDIARKYMGAKPDFRDEYFPALFLYSLAVTKYYQESTLQPTRLAFVTACVQAKFILSINYRITFNQESPTESLPPSRTKPSLGTGNRWAVLVGVDEYEDRANYGRLRICVRDVDAIREQLVAGGFDPARIRLFTDRTTDELPTRANVLAALKAVADATERDDLLLFYYSGHGDEANGESYLVGRDGRQLVLDDTAVLISRVKEIMLEAPARAKVIILDACHSGADVGGKGPKPMSAEFIRRVFEEAEGLAILASCKQGQLSYAWRAQERSVFTHFLLEALAGQADREQKGFVTVQDANQHVTDGVKLWASQNNVSQMPTLQYAVVGDIILARYS
jgi:hypothetical protein